MCRNYVYKLYNIHIQFYTIYIHRQSVHRTLMYRLSLFFMWRTESTNKPGGMLHKLEWTASRSRFVLTKNRQVVDGHQPMTGAKNGSHSADTHHWWQQTLSLFLTPAFQERSQHTMISWVYMNHCIHKFKSLSLSLTHSLTVSVKTSNDWPCFMCELWIT